KANGRDNDKMHGSDVRRVVAQEGAPSLTWWPRSLDHVFGHRRLGDLKAELEQPIAAKDHGPDGATRSAAVGGLHSLLQGFEWQGQDCQSKELQRDHRAMTLGDSCS